jgi:hypothetical protein
MTFDPEVGKAIQRLSDQLADASPEAAEVIAKLRSGEIDQIAAMSRLMTLDGIAPLLEKLAMDTLAPLRAESSILPDRVKVQLPDLPGEGPGLLYQETGLPRLHPLMEASIAELVQFDGDAPLLRHGPMPEGATPAVPVDTNARNPVALGSMLTTASEEVAAELVEAQEAYEAEARFLEESVKLLGVGEQEALQIMEDNLPAPPAGVKGYIPGARPEVRIIKDPTGSALAAMPQEERQQAAWKALSTSQGRRSALSTLSELILVGLASEGYPMEGQPPTRAGAEAVRAFAQWSVSLGGVQATQSNFSFIDVASKVLLRKLMPQLQKAGDQVVNPALEVIPVDTVDVRKVGWAARVVEKEMD